MEQTRMMNWEHSEPDEPDEEEGLPVKIQLILVVTAVTFVTILFEKSKEYIMDAASGEMHKVLESVFSELTVMGFIGLVIFSTDKAELLDEDATALVERVHMIIFAIAVIFLLQIVMLIRFSTIMSNSWHSTEHMLHGDEIKGRMLLVHDFATAKAAFSEGLLSWFSWKKLNGLRTARFNLEYHGIRDAFVSLSRPGLRGLHHKALPHDGRRLMHLVEEHPELITEFHMAEYLHHLMAEMFAEFVEIPPTTWITIYVVFTIFWAIDDCSNQLTLFVAFLTMPYWLILLLTSVIFKQRQIRFALVPDVMYKAADALKMITEGRSDGEKEALIGVASASMGMGSVYGSLGTVKGAGAMKMAPDDDSNDDSDDGAETSALIRSADQSGPEQMSTRRRMATIHHVNEHIAHMGSSGVQPQAIAGSINNGDKIEMAAPGVYASQRDDLRRADGSPRAASPSLNGVYQTLRQDGRTVKMKKVTFQFLHDVLKSHRQADDFADVRHIPFLRECRRGSSRESFKGDGLFGSCCPCSLPTGLADWLNGVHHKHGVNTVLNPHERLFWFGRRGPDYLMYLIRLAMVSNAVFLSVMATHWMPKIYAAEALKEEFGIDEDSFIGVQTFRVISTLAAFLPSIVVCFRLYRALELFVIVSFVGFNRIPEVMLKVIRSAKTRKSLSVLKLLSSVKSAMVRTSTARRTDSAMDGVHEDVEEEEDGESTSAEHSGMHKVAAHTFALFDGDGNGSIDKAEFHDLLNQLGITHTEKELDKIWVELDDDGSGTIERNEFLSWVDTVESSGATDLSTDGAITEFVDHIFSVIDVDGDGHISSSELFNCLDRLGQGVTFDDVQNIMAEVDEDASGGVDKKEFTDLIRKNADYI